MPFAVLSANLPAGIIGRIRQKTRTCVAWLKGIIYCGILEDRFAGLFFILLQRLTGRKCRIFTAGNTVDGGILYGDIFYDGNGFCSGAVALVGLVGPASVERLAAVVGLRVLWGAGSGAHVVHFAPSAQLP